MTPQQLLGEWLGSRLPSDPLDWLWAQGELLTREPKPATLQLLFSLVPRITGKEPLGLEEADRDAAKAARRNWDPGNITVDQASRLWLLLALSVAEESFVACLDQLFLTADLSEQVLLYQALPLYPYPHRHRLRAAEGLRSSIPLVFDAVALRNPYPAEQLSEQAWNQMVLKALFLGSPLHPIVGLDERANPRLASMLHDHAHERWAAGRSVSHELWRCVGPFLAGDRVADLHRVLTSASPLERQAAALALASSADPRAAALLGSVPTLSVAVASDAVSWQSLAAVA